MNAPTDMALRALTTKAERGFVEHYHAARATLPAADSPWVRAMRERAIGDYAARGLPHRRIEEWKYTDLRASLSEAFPPAPHIAGALSWEDVAQALGPALSGLPAHRLVVVDGRFRPELSDLEAVGRNAELLSLADGLSAPPAWLRERFGAINAPQGDPLIALNTALMTGGVLLRVADGARFDLPLHIVHVHAAKDAASLATRHFISVGEGASVTLLESYVSASHAPVQRIAATELDIGRTASVRHLKVQREGEAAAHLATWMVGIGAEASYHVVQLSTGAGLARNQLFVRFDGEGAVGRINGCVLGRGRQHNDTTLVVDHAVPACESRELFKTVLDDRARAVFQGKVIVRRHAQKSDGKQMAQGLLLSEEAEFDSKPELEIFADDVICGHGSTSGQINADLLFYLRSRGIPEAEARRLLIIAFIGETLDLIEDEALRAVLMAEAEAWLAGKEQR